MPASSFLKHPLQKLRQQLFNHVHGQQLIYNACWEDPRCDRTLLNITPESRVITITSAGCNALDYLLDRPQAIYCLDTNPRQNALMELKMAVFSEASFDDLDQLFGNGYHPHAWELYRQLLRPVLSYSAQAFWDQKIGCFTDSQKRGSFYFYGMAGQFAWYFNQYLRTRPKLYRASRQLLQAKSLEEQAERYYKLEPRLIPGVVQWLLNRQAILSMLGVPPAQRRLMQLAYSNGLTGYIKSCLRWVFTQTYLPHNYFWYLYMTGQYPPEHRPNYLQPYHFDTIKNHLSKIQLRTASITDFLKAKPGQYTHFILLDHQDWLAERQPRALQAEWDLIAENSAPAARTLMRSAAPEVHFLPSTAYEHFHFQKLKPGEEPHSDRVGTYQSTYLGFKQVNNSLAYGLC